MKFVFEVDLTRELNNTNNFKKIVGKFFDEVLDRIPNNSVFEGIMDNMGNRTVKFENCKAMLLSNAACADEHEDGSTSEPVVRIQALVTDLPLVPLDPVTSPTDKRVEERVNLER